MKLNLLPNLITLLVFTAIPALGILFWGWDWRQVILLYWFGNVTSGLTFFIASSKKPPVVTASALETNTASPLTRLALTFPGGNIMKNIFLLFHFGIFTIVHGVFVFAMINGAFMGGANNAEPINYWFVLLPWVIATIVQVIFVSIKPTAAYNDPLRSVGRLYVRVIALHVVILGGAVLIMMLHLPAATALLLIAVHAIFELASMCQQRKFSGIVE